MSRISTTGRLSLGLVMVTISILVSADMFGLIPNHSKETLARRGKICEALAVYCSVAAQKDDSETILTTAEVLVYKNEDILSAAVRGEDGTLMVATVDHETHWQGAPERNSTSTHVRVPIFEGESLWGTLEVAFEPVEDEGFWGILSSTLFRLVAYVVLAGFFLYRFFLKRTLRHLDPTSVVPPRVKAALDALSEGIVLVDKNERIVLANTAFAEKVGLSQSTLMGRKASELNWTDPATRKKARTFPWVNALQKGQSQPRLRLGLPVQSGKWRTFMVNGTPILDTKGNCRGAIATFDDVTQVEKQNEQLQIMLEKLEKSRDAVRRQNNKLEILATRDPLTNCLNRRAFFERFAGEWSAAKRYKYDVSCIMLDIDHFKSINDTHGHAKGDDVLKGVSGVIQSLLRKNDIVCRYGGEEFCVILPHTDIKGGVLGAERIRRQIEAREYSGVPATVSLGVSSLALGAEDLSELINQADNVLYSAKEGGRNRVVSWKDLNPDISENSELEVMAPEDHEASSETVTTQKDSAGTSANLDEVSKAKTRVAEAIGQDSQSGSRSKDALGFLSQALNDSADMSRSMGLHVSQHAPADVAIQLNQNGGWGDDGEIDEKDRPHASSISQAAAVLKAPSTKQRATHSGLPKG